MNHESASRIQAIIRGYITRTAIYSLTTNLQYTNKRPINQIDPVHQTPIPSGIGTLWVKDGNSIFQFPLHTLFQYLPQMEYNPFTRTLFDTSAILKRIRKLFQMRHLPVLVPLCERIQWPVMHTNAHERVLTSKKKRLLFPRPRCYKNLEQVPI